MTFLLLCLSFLLFGLTSLNLLHLLQANFDLLIEHGWLALMDGALRQLVELIISGLISAIFYLLFKTCEKVLVERLTEKKD